MDVHRGEKTIRDGICQWPVFVLRGLVAIRLFIFAIGLFSVLRLVAFFFGAFIGGNRDRLNGGTNDSR